MPAWAPAAGDFALVVAGLFAADGCARGAAGAAAEAVAGLLGAWAAVVVAVAVSAVFSFAGAAAGPPADLRAAIEAGSNETVDPPAPATTSCWLTRVPQADSDSPAASATIANRRLAQRLIGAPSLWQQISTL
jgi:hypothetical protein